MDLATIMQAVATLGFPICCCGAMMWYVKYITDKNREEIDDMTAQHHEEMSEVTTAINNNTIALTKLCERLGGIDDGR